MTGRFRHPDRALYIHFHVFRGVFDRGHNVPDAGKMENQVHIPEERAGRLQLPDVFKLHLEPAIPLVMRKIVQPTTGKVIDHPHLQTLLQKKIHHVAADEAGATGDQGNAGSGIQEVTSGPAF